MTITETIKALTEHQEWRTGGDGPATDPKELTRATLAAIAHLKSLDMLIYKLKTHHITKPGIAALIKSQTK